MKELHELIDIKNRLEILTVNIADIIANIENDSILETRKSYNDFLEFTHGDDITDYEIAVRKKVVAHLENIMYWSGSKGGVLWEH